MATCADCKFYKSKSNHCVRNPPHVAVFIAGADELGRPRFLSHSTFTMSAPTEWCGEHVARIAMVQAPSEPMQKPALVGSDFTFEPEMENVDG
jgi:hypothetical protein